MEKTMVNIILDESGSMQQNKETTISGFNEYVDSLRSHGSVVRFSLTKFNGNRVQVVCTDTPIKDAPELTEVSYQPDNVTPLYDAIGRAIKSVEGAVEKRADEVNVLFVVITDGLENASREYDRKKVFDMIKEKEEASWCFAYLGADRDVWIETEKIGISAGNTVALDFADATAFATTCAATERYLASPTAYSSSFMTSTVGDSLDDGIAKYAAKINNRMKKEVKDGRTKKSL